MYIYGLIDPRNGELRYVGATTVSLRHRLYGHVDFPKTKSQTPLAKWLRELDGESPEIFEIEAVDDSWGPEAERFYIQYFRYIGCRLTNVILPAVCPPIDIGKIDWSLPKEVLDLLGKRNSPPSKVKRSRGRPRSCKPCVLCGGKGYAAPVIEGEKVDLCKSHYHIWYGRKRRAAERG